LIVPDGNWRQASKVHHRHPEIKHMRRVKIGVRDPGLKFIRRETRPLGMATLQAISFAMGVLEGPKVEEHLLSVYQAKWEQTLKSRGTLKEFTP
jgi:DTW domain-containing protein YfiP